MISIPELLRHVDALRRETSVVGIIPPCFYEVKVIWDHEFLIRIIDCPPNVTDRPPPQFNRDHTNMTFLYARNPFEENAPLEYLGPLLTEHLVLVSYEPGLDRYTLTEVDGASGTYKSPDVLSHLVGVVNSTDGADHDHIRTIGRAMLRELAHNTKRHVLNFRSMAHLIHQFHREINIAHNEDMRLVWRSDHQIQYRHFKLMDPSRKLIVPDSHVSGLVRAKSMDLLE